MSTFFNRSGASPPADQIVLHLQRKQDGTVRLMLNQMRDGQKIPVKTLESGVVTDENAQRVYEAVFRKYHVDAVAARIWNGSGWIRTWFDLGEHYEERVAATEQGAKQ